MSHNAIKVGSAAPDVTGAITLSVSDLSDVSAAGVVEGQALQFSSSTGTWTPAALPGNEYIYIGTSAALQNAEASGMVFSAGGQMYFQTTALRNTITGASVSNAPSKTYWYGDVTLPAGKYSIASTIFCIFSSTGHCATSWKRTDTGDSISNIAAVGADLSAYPAAPGSMIGGFELDVSATIRCTIDSVAGASASQTSFVTAANFVLIRRLA